MILNFQLKDQGDGRGIQISDSREQDCRVEEWTGGTEVRTRGSLLVFSFCRIVNTRVVVWIPKLLTGNVNFKFEKNLTPDVLGQTTPGTGEKVGVEEVGHKFDVTGKSQK